MLKLYHTAYSKFTSVSLANSYSKITGQPVRGRKRDGGQHISWQTLAALLGHKEHSGILKELYTIKSDAPIKDKEKFLMQYITHGNYKLKPKYTSLTKRAVNNALKILGMQLED
jgi:DNA-directed RNA polymerase beta subunit